MLSSALLSSRFGGATRVERDLVPAAGRQAAMLRQRRRRQQQHSSSTSTSTPAIWDRWGSNKKTGESNPASVDASTETEALLLESVGEKWRPREGGRRRKKRDKTAGENGRPKKKKKTLTTLKSSTSKHTPRSRRGRRDDGPSFARGGRGESCGNSSRRIACCETRGRRLGQRRDGRAVSRLVVLLLVLVFSTSCSFPAFVGRHRPFAPQGGPFWLLPHAPHLCWVPLG